MTSSTNVQDAITEANETFMTNYAQGDAAGVAALYTENAQFLVPNKDAVKGRKAIQATFQAFLDMGIKEIKLETDELEDFGDTAHEVGRYTLRGEGSQVMDQGKFLVIWKQEADQWKLHRDMINTSMPASE